MSTIQFCENSFKNNNFYLKSRRQSALDPAKKTRPRLDNAGFECGKRVWIRLVLVAAIMQHYRTVDAPNYIKAITDASLDLVRWVELGSFPSLKINICGNSNPLNIIMIN